MRLCCAVTMCALLLTSGSLLAAVADTGAVVYAPGDLNGDGRYTEADVKLLEGFLSGRLRPPCSLKTMDVNGDGRIDVGDLVALSHKVLGGTTPPCQSPIPFTRGDLNGDGQINLTDAVILCAYLAGEAKISVPLDAADVNGDGRISMEDLKELLNALFVGSSPDPKNKDHEAVTADPGKK